MALSQKTQKLVWGKFAARCAICHKSLVHSVENVTDTLLGEIAHIVGEKESAARGKADLTDAQRNSEENLLLLCRDHHKIIDDQEANYSVQKLLEIKSEFSNWLEGTLAPTKPWKISVGAFAYLNVPRLYEFAALNGFDIKLKPEETKAPISDLGYDLNYLMAKFQLTLENIAIQSVKADDLGFAHENYIGQIVNFDQLRFRTKNIAIDRKSKKHVQFIGDLAVDPHIYYDFKSWKLILNIDTNWITTTTAHTMFRPTGGQSTFTGFARINAIDYAAATMTGSALALGIPNSSFWLDERGGTQTPADGYDLSSLEDEMSKSRNQFWIGDIENCDFCGKRFEGEVFMIDGPMQTGGPWGNMCAQCYGKKHLPLGIGKGQLYRADGIGWRLVGGYQRTVEQDESPE